jgi:hypothetical protein
VSYAAPKELAAAFDGFKLHTKYEAYFPAGPLFEISNLRPKAWLIARSASSVGVLDFLTGPFACFGRLLDFSAGQHLPITALRAGHGEPDFVFGIQVFFSQRRVLPKKTLSAIGIQPEAFAFTLASLGPDPANTSGGGMKTDNAMVARQVYTSHLIRRATRIFLPITTSSAWLLLLRRTML